MIGSPSIAPVRRRSSRIGLYAAAVLYATAFLAYAESMAFHFDETYHLLAAQLILAGKRPYVDFCFPQAPFNAYWNALWMALFGQTWRVAHAAAALATIGAVLLMADYAARRFPRGEWRITAATAGIVIGLSPVVFSFGSVAQPYGICLLALTAAFRCAVCAVERESARCTAAAGLFAGVAAASSLLTAAAVPVLLAWILVCRRAGRRVTKALAFLSAAALPFAPALWLFVLSPRATWFNLVEYHLFYRRLYWPDPAGHDFEVLTSWLESAPALVLGLLAVCGWLYVLRHSDWPRPVQAELRLCAWLALGIAAEVAFARPTFEQYFLLIVPFLAVPAAAGMYALAMRVLAPRYGMAPVLAVAALFSLSLVRFLYEEPDNADWSAYERVARQVDSVTPPDAPVFATEPIYFLTRRTPPSGLELYYTHLLDLPPAQRALFHLLTYDDLRGQLHAGRFATAYESENDTVRFDLGRLYRHSKKMDDCTVYWDFRK
jgi:hypothetical protein